MKKQIRAFASGLVLATLLLVGTSAFAENPQYGVFTTSGNVFVADYSKPGVSPTNVTGSLPQGVSFADVAVWGNNVFVSATTGTSGKLYIGQIDVSGLAPKINWSSTINLTQLVTPSKIAVDGTGGVFIINGPSPSPTYSSVAYLPSVGNWNSAGLQVNSIASTYSLADVAASSTLQRAIVAQTSWGENPPVHTWVSAINNGSLETASDHVDLGCLPNAVAMGTNGLAYIANRSTDDANDPGWVLDQGSISVVSSSSLQSASNLFSLGAFRPTDISFFTLGTTNYLGVVGTNEGVVEAKRIALDASGALTSSILTKTFDISAGAQCSVSPDGKTIWITTSPSGGGKVTALNTSDWTSALNWTASGQPLSVAVYAVPEPGSLAVLLTGALGLIGTLRRRRQ